MATTINEFPVEFLNSLDKVLTQESYSARYDVPGAEFVSKKTVKVPEITFANGMKDYDEFATDTGAELTFRTYELDHDKQAVFHVDAVEDIDTAHILTTNLNAEFLREKAVPEMDKDFFDAVKANAGTKVSDTLTSSNIVSKIRTASDTLFENGVGGKVDLYISSAALTMLREAYDGSREWSSDSNISTSIGTYESMDVYKVPAVRFGTLDFALIAQGSIRYIKKRAVTYLFQPGAHTEGDNWLSQSRWVYGAIVRNAAKMGLYVNYTNTESKLDTFSITPSGGTAIEGVIDQTAKTVAISAPSGTTVTGVTIGFTASEGATLKQGNTSIVSGTTTIDFTSGTAKKFKVVSEAGTAYATEYNVTVTVA